jgi:hypothetical protein
MKRSETRDLSLSAYRSPIGNAWHGRSTSFGTELHLLKKISVRRAYDRPMELYVCWGTYREPFHEHACRKAHQELLAAGHDPKVIRVRGLGVGPRLLQWTTSGRRRVEELSGQKVVPVLRTDEGEVIVESAAIAEWAEAHPVSG